MAISNYAKFLQCIQGDNGPLRCTRINIGLVSHQCLSSSEGGYLSVYSFVPYFQRRVQHVAKENEFYMQLINLALPPETNNHSEATERPSRGMTLSMYDCCEIFLYVELEVNAWGVRCMLGLTDTLFAHTMYVMK